MQGSAPATPNDGQARRSSRTGLSRHRKRGRNYARQADAAVAIGFIDAVDHVLAAIARTPAGGSLRYAFELDIPDLRVRSVKRHPYLIFYVERADWIDLWRVLHAPRDIPSWLVAPGDPQI